MSFDHKAFVFDSVKFDQELKILLESSLVSEDVSQLRSFIISNRPSLTDPYEGEPLEDDWQDMIEEQDAHQFGDFALTKYYSPLEDLGLGDEWEQFQTLFSDIISNDNGLPFLGMPVGEKELFDPGKMGSYFQTSEDVKVSLDLLNNSDVSIPDPDELQEAFNRFKDGLRSAVNSNQGLYITF